MQTGAVRVCMAAEEDRPEKRGIGEYSHGTCIAYGEGSAEGAGSEPASSMGARALGEGGPAGRCGASNR